MKKIVYNPTYRYGIKEKQDGVICHCLFYGEKSEKNILSSFLEEVDEVLIRFMIDGDFYPRFYSQIRSRGAAYYRNKAVKELSYDPLLGLKAKVEGNDIYDVTIYRNAKRINMNCDCPVNGYCKHMYAACLAYQEVFAELNARSGFNNEELIRLTDLYTSGNSFYDENIMAIVETLKKQDDPTLVDYVSYVDRTVYGKKDAERIYEALSYNNALRERYVTILNEDRNAIASPSFLRKIRRISGGLEDDRFSTDDLLKRAFYNGDHERLFVLLNSNRENGNVYLINDVMEKIKIDDTKIDEFIACSNRFNMNSYFNRAFFKKCDQSQKLRIANEDEYIALHYSDIKDLSRQEKIRLLPRISHFEDREISGILKDDLDTIDDHKTIAGILLNMCENCSYNSGRKIVEYARKLRNSDYIVELLENRIDRDYRYRHFHERTFHYDRKKIDRLDQKAIDEYFEMNFIINKEGETYVILYNLYGPDHYRAYCVERFIDEDNYLDKDPLYFIYEKDFIDKNDLIANYLIYTIENFFKESYESKLKEIEEEIKEAIDERRLDLAKNKIEVLNKDYLRKNIELLEEHKASLMYQFFIADQYYRKRYELSLKVGIGKYYVIKSISAFFERFKDEGSFAYGKELELTHRLDNFIETDQKNLNLLLNIHSEFIGSGNRLSINENLFEQLLCNLKDQYVIINDHRYLNSQDEVEFRPLIDRDYILRFDKDLSNREFLHLKKKIFILDRDNDRINVLKADRNEIALYMFLYENRDLCIKKIINEFKEKIYALQPDLIEIDEEIKEGFKLNSLVINAYFDYADKCITVRSEYRINENPVDEKKITNSLDVIRKNNYQKYLANMGFVDDVMDDDRDVLNFFNMDFSALKKFCNVYLSDSIQNKKVALFAPGQIRVSYSNNIMEAFLEGSEFSDEELEEILKSIKRKKDYVLLSNDRIIDLSGDDVREFYDAVNDLGLDQKKLSQPTVIPIIRSLKAFAYEDRCRIDDYLKNMIGDIASFKENGYEPPSLNAVLRPYQIDAYKWLKILSRYHVGGILADDMGLGKTIEIISLIVSDDSPKPNLIVCPKSLVFNWKNEFARFAPDEIVEEIYGGKNERKDLIDRIDEHKKITYITSYDSLNRDSENYRNRDFNYLIIDEAQAIKNVQAMKTQSVKNIRADNRFALTGTPIENNIIDLWSIFDFIMPGYFLDLNEFKNNADNDDFILKIARRVAPFILRRTKTAVLKDLPEKYETIISCEMNTGQRKVYDAQRKQAKDKLENGGKAFDVLPYLMRLRQICVDPATFIDDYKGKSAKMETLSELIDDYLEKGHRILIFSQFVKALNIVEEILKTKKLPYFMITGETEARRRTDIADNFNNGSKEKIVLISLKAGGTGLNLIGADTVIHLDPWWNVAAENQASDRSHRIGQTRNVEVIKLICENSIEQRVIELQNIKKDLIDKLIADDDSSITSASLEDIRFILD